MLSDKHQNFLSACLLYELGWLTGLPHMHAHAFTCSSERDCQVSMYHQSQLGVSWSITCFPMTHMLNTFPTKGNFVKWYPQGLYVEQIHPTPDCF